MNATEIAAFLVRLAATGGVVLGITLAVGRLGTRAGGMLAGLPIVVGPGFVFLAMEEDPAFIARAATFSLLSLCATQAFMLAYLVAARRSPPAASVAIAILAWLAAAAVLATVDIGPVPALALFAASTGLARIVGGRLRIGAAAIRGRDSLLALLARAGLAGLLVGAITAASARLGPHYSGLLLAYPVGMTVIALSVHRRYGAAKVIDTLYATALGATSIAAFCFVAALTAPAYGSALAVASGFGASFLLTLALLARPRSAR